MSTSPSNYVTKVAVALSKDYLSVTSDGTSSGTKVSLSDGRSLGIVQSVDWSMDVGGVSRSNVTVLAAPGEVKSLLSNTTIRVKPADGYHPFRYLYDWYAAKLFLLFTVPVTTSQSFAP